MMILLLKILSAMLIFGFGLITVIKNSQSKVNRSFLKLTCAISFWIIFYSLAQAATHEGRILKDFLLGYVGIIFIPIFFYEFIARFLNLKQTHKVFNFLYFIGLALVIFFLFTDKFVVGLWRYPWGYYPKVNIAFHPLFILFFMSLFSLAFTFLCLQLIGIKNKSVQLSKLKYVLWGSVIASFASIDFLPNYGINIYPFGFVFTLIFPLIFGYAIVRYRLMDVTLVITRTSIFVAVYSLVLGIPFAIAFGLNEVLREIFNENWWMFPLISSTVLATIGPFIYLYIQKKAEDRLLQEQRRYQFTLRQASSGMGRIKDLKKLVTLIVYIVTRSVRIEHSIVYVFDDDNNVFTLGAFKNSNLNPPQTIDIKSPMIKYLNQVRAPIVFEEIQQRMQDYKDADLEILVSELLRLDAALVVPSWIEDRLIGVLIMGKKISGSLYSEDDLSVFSILANQAALAIENAMFYENMKTTQEQLLQAEKMATIGTMADGLSHQINNRFHALGFIAGDALDTINMKKNAEMSDEMREVIADLEKSFTRVQENVKQGGEIVQGLLRYTRKGEEGFAPVELDKLITAAYEMTQFKIKKGDLTIVRSYEKDVPKIKGNFTQLQEVFFNLIDNGYDAMMQRKTEKKEPDFKPTLTVSVQQEGTLLKIDVCDNGIGVKEEDKHKIFTPFFTTKLSSKKGTGLGLYVIKKIIEENHGGKVECDSKYMVGTTMRVILPASEEAQKA